MSILDQFDDSIRKAAKEAAWLHSIIDIPGSSSGTTPHEESTGKIRWEIPETLAENGDYKYYEPSVVSIGPCHYVSFYDGPMDKFKRKAVRELLLGIFSKNCSGEMVSIEKVYKSVEQDLLSVRDYYDLRPNISDSEWCEIMFRDGCFVIYFITSDRRSWINTMNKHDRDLVWRDLLLISNQLPFRVLSVLQQTFRHSDMKSLLYRMLLTISCHSVPPTFDDYMNKVTRQQGEPLHLLQCYRDLWMHILFGDHVEEDHNEEEQAEEKEDNNKEEDHLAVFPPFSVTELKKVGIRCSLKKVGIPCSFKKVGIRCNWASNSMNYPKGIHLKLSMLSGKLFLPQLIIDEWTMTNFYNLVAYEYSYNLQKRSVGITSYLSFMSMLIKGEEDVKELRARGVVQLDLKGGDDQVVNFLRYITAHREPNPQDFKDVKQQISIYSKSKWLPLRIGYAEFKQRYFSGPWSFLVFLAVIFTVSMTVIQTIFTGIQTYK